MMTNPKPLSLNPQTTPIEVVLFDLGGVLIELGGMGARVRAPRVRVDAQLRLELGDLLLVLGALLVVGQLLRILVPLVARGAVELVGGGGAAKCALLRHVRNRCTWRWRTKLSQNVCRVKQG